MSAALATTAAAVAAKPTAPAPLTILTSHGPVGRGDIFLTPTADTGTYANGAEMTDRNTRSGSTPPRPATSTPTSGLSGWTASRSSPSGRSTNFGGLSDGTDYVYNDRYHQIAAVRAGNGLTTDGHEFLISPSNTALILSYDTATANLTSIGGPVNSRCRHRQAPRGTGSTSTPSTSTPTAIS